MKEIPQHIAIIMDGNGRWAQARGLDRSQGHIEGAKAVRSVVEAAREAGIRYLTLYAFSTENWARPKEEVDALMALLVKSLQNETTLLQKHHIRLRVIGDIDSLNPQTHKELLSTLALTETNTAMDLVLALSYGSRFEILNAVRQIADKLIQGQIKSEEINAELFSNHLQTSFMTDPDLMIRTSGESRLSNFLLWQCAYTEFYFTPVLWPDFTKEHFAEAISYYRQKERRFGKTTAQIEQV